MPKQDTGLRGVLLDGRRICCRLSHFVERYRPFQTIFVQMEIGHGVVRCGRLYFLRGEFRFTRVKSRRKFYQDERENIMKKVLALLLTLIMTVSLAGCGGSGDTGGSASAEGEVKSGVEDGFSRWPWSAAMLRITGHRRTIPTVRYRSRIPMNMQTVMMS